MSIKNSAINLGRLADVGNESTPNGLVLRDEQGTFKVGPPTDPEHPVRLGDLSELDVGSGGGPEDLVRLDLMSGSEDVLHPSNFPVQLGEKAAFFGVAYEIVTAEGFEQGGTYHTYFHSIYPTFTHVVQIIEGGYVKFIRTGEMGLDGSTTVYDLSEWRAYSVPFSTSINSVNIFPNVTTTLSSLSAMVTVNVSNATAEVTVTSDSKTILRWTPTSSSDTHTFTFANLPSAQVTIGSSGSFVIDSAWYTI